MRETRNDNNKSLIWGKFFSQSEIKWWKKNLSKLNSLILRDSFYNPVIFIRIKYKVVIVSKKTIGIIKRNFLILNKLRNGAIMTNIKPNKLLIKKRG